MKKNFLNIAIISAALFLTACSGGGSISDTPEGAINGFMESFASISSEDEADKFVEDQKDLNGNPLFDENKKSLYADVFVQNLKFLISNGGYDHSECVMDGAPQKSTDEAMADSAYMYRVFVHTMSGVIGETHMVVCKKGDKYLAMPGLIPIRQIDERSYKAYMGDKPVEQADGSSEKEIDNSFCGEYSNQAEPGAELTLHKTATLDKQFNIKTYGRFDVANEYFEIEYIGLITDIKSGGNGTIDASITIMHMTEAPEEGEEGDFKYEEQGKGTMNIAPTSGGVIVMGKLPIKHNKLIKTK